MVVYVRSEYLRFALEPAECRTVNYPVPVALERRSIGMFRFGVSSAPAVLFRYRQRLIQSLRLSAGQLFYNIEKCLSAVFAPPLRLEHTQQFLR
jgi:hypothetical protein